MIAARGGATMSPMPTVICRSCGESAFTISGWADADRCPNCGRPLGVKTLRFDNALAAKRRLEGRERPKDGSRPEPVSLPWH
jgi:hypothetical protein